MAAARPVPGDPAIELRLRARLRAGPITFAELMATALYDPEAGYYVQHGPGRDYRSAPQTSPAFGHLLGVALARMWRAMGAPSRFDALEIGAADGRLAGQVVRYARAREPGLANALRYWAMDVGAGRLAGASSGADAAEGEPPRLGRLIGDAAALPFSGIHGCVLSNELFDALPVSRLVLTRDGWRELWVVGVEPDQRRFQAGELSDPRLLDELAARGVRGSVGQVVDLAVGAGTVMGEIARALKRGFVLTIDYGGGAELYGPLRRAGTLVAYHRHRASERVLDRPGEQDLTAHVDFAHLRRVGEAHGLATLRETTQRDLLLGLELRDWLGRLDPTRMTPADLFNARAAAAELVDPGRLGKLRVLLQARGVDGIDPLLGQ